MLNLVFRVMFFTDTTGMRSSWTCRATVHIWDEPSLVAQWKNSYCQKYICVDIHFHNILASSLLLAFKGY